MFAEIFQYFFHFALEEYLKSASAAAMDEEELVLFFGPIKKYGEKICYIKNPNYALTVVTILFTHFLQSPPAPAPAPAPPAQDKMQHVIDLLHYILKKDDIEYIFKPKYNNVCSSDKVVVDDVFHLQHSAFVKKYFVQK